MQNHSEEVWIDENYEVDDWLNLQGDIQLSCYIRKAKKEKAISRIFGKWNRRFLFFNLDPLEMYYCNKPTSESRQYLPLEVYQLIISENNQDQARLELLEEEEGCRDLRQEKIGLLPIRK